MDPVEEQVEAYNAHDLERFIACYSPDVVIEDGVGNRLLQGRDSMREMYGRTFSSSPNAHGEILQRIRVEPFVVDEERVTGLNMPGSPGEVHAAVIYRLDGDMIVHVRMLFAPVLQPFSTQTR